MWTLFFRTLILYLLVIAALRVMGKRQLGELQPSELVVAIMISDLAAIPIEDGRQPIWDGIIPILTLVAAEFILSTLVIKSELCRRIITGRPTVVIEKGRIKLNTLRRLRMSLDDLLEQLRLKGYSQITEVDSAMLETNGQISVIPKEKSRPLTCEDMRLDPSQTHLPHTLIADGTVRESGLREAGLSPEQLMKLLKQHGVASPKEVFYMNITDGDKVFLQKKEERK